MRNKVHVIYMLNLSLRVWRCYKWMLPWVTGYYYIKNCVYKIVNYKPLYVLLNTLLPMRIKCESTKLNLLFYICNYCWFMFTHFCDWTLWKNILYSPHRDVHRLWRLLNKKVSIRGAMEQKLWHFKGVQLLRLLHRICNIVKHDNYYWSVWSSAALMGFTLVYRQYIEVGYFRDKNYHY